MRQSQDLDSPPAAQRPSRLWRRLLYAAVAAVAASGAVSLSAKYLFATAGTEGPVLPAWASMASTVHGGFALLATVVFGATLGAHAYLYRRATYNRLLGYLLIAAFSILLLTGYGLYYLGNDTLRGLSSLLHWTSGIALLPILIAHVLTARRRAAFIQRFARAV
jgi:type IV secretory pathway VirB2 component (pilin)